MICITKYFSFLIIASAGLLPACASSPEATERAGRCVVLRSFTTATPTCRAHHGVSWPPYETAVALSETVQERLTLELRRTGALGASEGCVEVSGEVKDLSACVESSILRLERVAKRGNVGRVCVEIDALVEDKNGTRGYHPAACAEFVRGNDEQGNVTMRNAALTSAADSAAIGLLGFLGY